MLTFGRHYYSTLGLPETLPFRETLRQGSLLPVPPWRTFSRSEGEDPLDRHGHSILVSLPTLTCYYHWFFLVPVLLAKALRPIGWLALLISGIGAILVLWPRVSYPWDDRFTTQSFVYLGFAFLILLGFLRDPREREK